MTGNIRYTNNWVNSKYERTAWVVVITPEAVRITIGRCIRESVLRGAIKDGRERGVRVPFVSRNLS